MKGRWGDARIEEIVGNLLRAGVVVAAGAVVFLIRHGGQRPQYGIFHGEPTELRSVAGIVRGALTGRGRGLIQLGLLLLVATPVARVVFSVIGFAIERDRAYVLITLTVLTVLLFSLAGGHF
jgi:uncharacterized membrane protein